MAVEIDELLVGVRLLDRVQILALDVLDQRELGGARIVNVADNRRNGMEPRPLRRPPAPLASNDLIALAVRAEQNWLKHAALGDGIGELAERLLVKLHPRLPRVGPDAGYFDLAHALRQFARGRRSCRLAEKRRQAHAEALGVTLGAHAACASCGRRPISSRARRI